MNTSPIAFSQPLLSCGTSAAPLQRAARQSPEPRSHSLPSAAADGLDVARLAHDLNNLLTPALMTLDLIRAELRKPSHCAMLDISKRSLLQATDMISEVVATARAGRARHALINPRHVVEEVFAFARETFPKDISVELEIEDHPSFIAASAAELHRALVNLCVNARDAMPAGGRLTLHLGAAAGSATAGADCADAAVHGIVIEVSDTGCGIPEEIRGEIFDPYFTTKGPGKGNGLGLASVKNVVEQHGGCLGLQSATGKGTTFRIFLPIV